MQCIETKYLIPTNTRGPRIVAKCHARRIVVPYDHAETPTHDGPHHAAAMKLARELGWEGEWHWGGLTSGEGNVYVNVLGAMSRAFTV